jgi:integrase
MKKIKGLYPRPNSPFYWMAYAVNGRTVRESTGCTDLKDAQKVLKAKRDLVGAARIGKATIVGADERAKTVHALLDTYLADCEVRGCRSLISIRSNVRAVDAALGSLKAATIDDDRVKAYTAAMFKANVAASTANHRLQTLKQALKPFFVKKLHRELPEIHRLPENNVRETYYSDAQAEALIAALPEDLRDYIRWAWLTSWRKGEISSLEWTNVDRQAKELRLSWRKSKSGKARTIALVGPLAAIIERRWAARTITADDGTVHLSPLVFHRGVQKNGRIKPVGTYRKAFRKACQAIGLEYGRKTGYTTHCFRRTGIRSMRKAGVAQSVIMSISGHQTESVFRRYDILDTSDTAKAILATQAMRDAQKPEPSNVVALKTGGSSR